MWPLEKLYQRPYVWGTKPQELAWSDNGAVLGFVWNAEGGRFLDLYAYRPATGKLTRVTNLEQWKDELLESADDKDARKSRYEMPPRGLTGFILSRDGARAAFSYQGELFIASTDGAAAEPFRLTRTKSGESDPQFSAVPGKLAAIRNGQVVIQDLNNGQLWQVTDVEAPDSLVGYWWSPDGHWVVYAVRKPGGRSMPLPNYSGRFVEARSFPRNVAGDEVSTPALFAVKASGAGKPVALEQGKWGTKAYTDDPVWSPDSKLVALRTVSGNQKEQQILAVDPATGKSRVLAEDKDEAWVFWSEFGWSPDSRWVWFNSERDGFAHIYKAPADASSSAVQLTRGKWEAREERLLTHPPQWVGDWIWFNSTEAGAHQRQIYRVKADGTGKERVFKRSGIDDVVVSDDGRNVALMHADLDNPFDLWVNGQRVTQSPRAEFATLPWPATRFVRFPSRGDNQQVAAKLLLPPGYDPAAPSGGKQWPCVFFIHGAGYATSVLEQWGSYNELRYAYNAWLASQGYVIMDLDYRGSSGYGRDWRTGVYEHMGGKDLDDVLGAVDYVRSLGNIEMKRLGIWGVSYGGFMTNMALFLAPGMFQAGSSWAAVNDWEHYNAFYTTQRLNTPQTSPEAYRRSSPIHFSAGLRDKLLIIHGMVDSNVLFQDAVQLTEKLIHEGKDFEHFYYPAEDHGFVRDETWIDALRRTTAWFDRWLGRR